MKQRKDKGGYHSIFKERRRGQAGRRCKYSGCMTILSVYNKGKYCGMHAGRAALKELREKDARLPYWVEHKVNSGGRK